MKVKLYIMLAFIMTLLGCTQPTKYIGIEDEQNTLRPISIPERTIQSVPVPAHTLLPEDIKISPETPTTIYMGEHGIVFTGNNVDVTYTYVEEKVYEDDIAIRFCYGSDGSNVCYGLYGNAIIPVALCDTEGKGRFSLVMSNPNDIALKIDTISLELVSYQEEQLDVFSFVEDGSGEEYPQLMYCTIGPTRKTSTFRYFGESDYYDLYTRGGFIDENENFGYVKLESNDLELFDLNFMCEEEGIFEYTLNVTYTQGKDIKTITHDLCFYATTTDSPRHYALHSSVQGCGELWECFAYSSEMGIQLDNELIEIAKRSSKDYVNYMIKEITASDHIENYPPSYAFDNDLSTTWAASSQSPWIEANFISTINLTGIYIEPGYCKSKSVYINNSTPILVKIIIDNYDYMLWELPYDVDFLQHSIYFDSISVNTIRLEVIDYVPGLQYDDICISNIHLWYELPVTYTTE